MMMNSEKLKIHIDFHNVKNPSLKNIILSPDFNPLINLILNCFINIRTFTLYYLNPTKESKIMRKTNGNPNILGPVFLKLLDHGWKSKVDEYTPSELHQILKKLMKENYKTQNPGLIFHFILSQLNNDFILFYPN